MYSVFLELRFFIARYLPLIFASFTTGLFFFGLGLLSFFPHYHPSVLKLSICVNVSGHKWTDLYEISFCLYSRDIPGNVSSFSQESHLTPLDQVNHYYFAPNITTGNKRRHRIQV